jgi:uncharacterized membrane protein YqhA
MFEHILKARYLAAIVVLVALLHAVAFLFMGAKIAVEAYKMMLLHSPHDASGKMQPGLELLHSLDFLFVAMVMIVLALGIAKLFLVGPKTLARIDLPDWLRFDSISGLKVLLWETILVTLVITGLSELTTSLFERLDWTALVTPAAILLLSLSLYLVKKH